MLIPNPGIPIGYFGFGVKMSDAKFSVLLKKHGYVIEAVCVFAAGLNLFAVNR